VYADVRSDAINAAVKSLVGPEFSAKDFRTWHATVLAAVGLAVSTRPPSESGRKRAVSCVVTEVAGYLGNTPAVCRGSYIDPRIFDRYRAGGTIAATLEDLAADHGAPATQGPIEAAVLDLLGG
jgi:DNA topoisomerase IB